MTEIEKHDTKLSARALVDTWFGLECVDLSVMLSEKFPVTWPTLPKFERTLLNWFEDYSLPNGDLMPSGGFYYDQLLRMDEHTGTHVDFPAHVLPPAELSKLPQEKRDVRLESFAGPCASIDARKYLDSAPAGVSPRVPSGVVEEWEARNGQLSPGEIVLLDTGYVDRYFAFPRG